LDQVSKDHNSLLRSISHSSQQKIHDQDSTGGDDPVDSINLSGAQYYDKNTHDKHTNEKKDIALSKLQDLPYHLQEQLNKNNRFGIHEITDKDSLDFVDADFIEYLAKTFGITDIQPLFIDHSGFVIWMLDKDGTMYEWNEMEKGLRYIGKDLMEGFTNFFFYPDNICQVMENTGERIPVKEFDRRMEERAKEIWNNLCLK